MPRDRDRAEAQPHTGEREPNLTLCFITFLPHSALAHGVGHLVGSIEVGKVADLVCFTPQFFGTKPELVLKSGIIVWSMIGDANASIPTTEPIVSRPMFGSFASAASKTSMIFVSQASIDNGKIHGYKLRKRAEAVKNCRSVSKRDMKLNDCMPVIKVDPETYRVTADGEECTCEPVSKLPLTQTIYLF